MAFGEPVNPVYDFRKADVVLSLDADFLQCGPGNLRYAADFMDRPAGADAPRAGRRQRPQMNRLYVVETAVSCTGAKADHRLALRPSEIEELARAMAAKLGVAAGGRLLAGPLEKWVAAVAKDLAGPSRPLPGAGRRPPAAGRPSAGPRAERPSRQRRPDGDATRRRSTPSRAIGPNRCGNWCRTWSEGGSSCW